MYAFIFSVMGNSPFVVTIANPQFVGVTVLKIPAYVETLVCKIKTLWEKLV